MGLGLSHGDFHVAYSTFGNWRRDLGKAAGYGVSLFGEYSAVGLDYDQFEERNYYGEWGETPDDILIVLFAHSDCEGCIYHKHLKPLAKRIESIKITENDFHESLSKKFVTALLDAYEEGEDLDFC